MNLEMFKKGELYASEIRNRRLQTLDLLGSNKTHQDYMTVVESDITQEINDVMDGTKKKYSNAESRQAEKVKRLTLREDYQNAKTTIAKNQRAIDELEISIQYFGNLLRLVMSYLN